LDVGRAFHLRRRPRSKVIRINHAGDSILVVVSRAWLEIYLALGANPPAETQEALSGVRVGQE
jgi:hypothetical protein